MAYLKNDRVLTAKGFLKVTGARYYRAILEDKISLQGRPEMQLLCNRRESKEIEWFCDQSPADLWHVALAGQHSRKTHAAAYTSHRDPREAVPGTFVARHPNPSPDRSSRTNGPCAIADRLM